MSSSAAAAASAADASHDIREQDRFLPVANINRIMKKVLPANAKVSKEAKEAIQECVSEFISFVTQEASDKVLQEKRKTVTGDDVLWAMSTLGFENYIEPLKIYLQKYRDSVKSEGRGGGGGGGGGSGSAKRSKTAAEDDEDEDEEEEEDDDE